MFFTWFWMGGIMLLVILAARTYSRRMRLGSQTGDADPPENPPEWDPGAADEHLPLNEIPEMQPRREVQDAVDENRP